MPRPDGYTEEQYVQGITAVVMCAGKYKQASRQLAEQGLEVPPQSLAYWCKDRFRDRYLEIRDKYAAQLEGGLIHDMRDLAIQGIEVQRVAIDAAHARLEAGEDEDPARTAAALSRVVQTNTDKMLALSGRPTSFRQDLRNPEEILRGLIAKFPGLIELPPEDVTEEVPEIEEEA